MFTCFSCDEKKDCQLKNARKCKKAREMNKAFQKQMRAGMRLNGNVPAHNLIRDKLKTI